ncbi:hypothetical protein [Ruminococcus sp.]|uniref:hypothetical protein n=1 Tax=Ruminococcus sp. TaxID=41978 RepID=UPI0025F6D6C7|nr:hypothetical protein [Ruminococcus sp.]
MANVPNRRLPDRAMQFAPFAALKGYYETVRKQERITQPKKELGDEEAKIISDTLNTLRVGMTVKIRYYDIDSYITIEGTITEVNEPYHRLKVNKISIPFSDIYLICITGISL